MIIKRKVVSICAAIFSLSWTTLQAADFYVNSLTDAVDKDLTDGVCLTSTGVCSLRAAIMQANYSPDADVITLRPGSHNLTITRIVEGGGDGELIDAQGDLDIFHNVTILGADPVTQGYSFILASPLLKDRIFHIKSSRASASPLNVTIDRVGLFFGSARTEVLGGGAILIAADRSGLGARPNVVITNSQIRSSFSPYTGSGLANWGGDVLLENSVVRGNASGYAPASTYGWQNNPRDSFLIGGGIGGGIAHWGGSMTIKASQVLENTAQIGGGIYVQDTFPAATLLVEDSELNDNIAFMGAGIASYAGIGITGYGVTFSRSSIFANRAELAGGGIYNFGSMLISNSAMTTNQTWDNNSIPPYPGKGGGIYHGGRLLQIENSTISGNTALDARTISDTPDFAMGGDEVFFDHTNMANNVSSTAFRKGFIFIDSIVGDSVDTHDNCHGLVGYQAYITTSGTNVDTGSTCFSSTNQTFTISKAMTTFSGNLINVSEAELSLGALQDNGGATTLPDGTSVKTMALSVGSIAVAAASGCPGGDQRNFARVGNCDVGAFQVAVDESTPGNAAPVTNDEIVSAEIGGELLIDVLSNDRDPDVGDELTLVSVNLVGVGSAAVVDGSLSYTAPSSNAGIAVLPVEVVATYTVTDGVAEATGNVTIWLYDVGQNTAPVGVADEFVVGQGQSTYLDVLANDSDADVGDDGRLLIYSDDLTNSSEQTTTVTTDGGNTRTTTATNTNTITLTNASADIPTPGGNLRLLNGGTIFLYTPNEDFVGVDEFTYDVVDPRGLKTTAVAVKVTINQTPVINETGIELTVNAGDTVIGNITATDAEFDEVSFMAVKGSQGLVEIDNVGAFSYTADPYSAGEDEFSLFVTDGMSSSSLLVRVNIIPGANTAPRGVADFVEVLPGQPFDINVVANDVDPDLVDAGNLIIVGEPVSLSAVGGSIAKLDDATVRFTPDAGFIGQYAFSYVVVDTQGAESAATEVIVDVRDNTGPEFYQSTYNVYVEAGESYSGQVKAKDADGDSVTYSISQTSMGTVSFNNTTGQFTYTAYGVVGSENITVTANDSLGGEVVATIVVNIQAKSSVSSLSSTGGNKQQPVASSSNSEGGAGAFNLYLMALIGMLFAGRRLQRRHLR